MANRCVLARFLVPGLVFATAAGLPQSAAGQTDYYNTDAGRPIQIEDAYPVERRGFEIQAAPLRLERSGGGVYHWGIEPELAFGILPRTQVEVGLPLVYVDAGARGRTTGLAGVELSALHNLNVETAIPALAIAASVLLPAGGLGPDKAYASVKGIVTRTFTWARFHVNGEYTLGSEVDAGAESAGVAEISRWMAGAAIDRTFPLRSMLITSEVFAREPLREGENIEWNAGAGMRYQLNPRWALDGGIGRRLTGDDRAWYATFGTAYAFVSPGAADGADAMQKTPVTVAAALLTWLVASDAGAQWSTTHDQFYLQAKHNWQFRHRHQAADRLFNAFDFGHAILYETLWRKPGAPVSELEEKWYTRLTTEILVHPPHVPLEEGAIEIAYARLAPEAKAMFDWAHILHRQIYDVLADERLSMEQKDGEVARLVAYYQTRPDLAFSSRPKSMVLMQEQPYSLAFRQKYPKFNALIWAYHWLQVGLYEPLLANPTSDSRQAGVRATVARFWQMLRDPPRSMPYVMPMTAAVAPTFTARYPEAAAIFDNLHSMHDVVSDILANPSVPRNRKRHELMLAARRFRDDTSHVMTVEAWRTMAQHMGIDNMGGPATNFLPELPTPTVTYGAVMTHDERTGEMTGFAYGQATGGAHAAMQHGAVADSAAGQVDPAAMQHGAADTTGPSMQGNMRQMMDVHTRMMADPVIRERVATDALLQRMMQSMPQQMTGDTMGGEGGHAMGGAASDTAEARQVMAFVTLLLSDPQVEARVHADPKLHRLWSDPQVQRCLETMRRVKASGQPLPATCPGTQQPAAGKHPSH